MRGFSLLETVLYLSLFSILFVGVLGSFIALRQSAGQSEALALLISEGTYLTENIERQLDTATSTLETEQLSSNGFILSSLVVTKIESSSAVQFSFKLSARTPQGKLISRQFWGSSQAPSTTYE